MKTYKLTKYERETTINYNEDEKLAEVYTCSVPVIRKMDELMRKRPKEVTLYEQTSVSKSYNVPKGWIKVIPPRTLSEDVKKRAAARLKAAREQQ